MTSSVPECKGYDISSQFCEGKLKIIIDEVGYLITGQKLIKILFKDSNGQEWALPIGFPIVNGPDNVWHKIQEGSILPNRCLLVCNDLVDVEIEHLKPQEFDAIDCDDDANLNIVSNVVLLGDF
jgi:hypothetical protein